ncbi:septum site-determining protein Ssd, partial [Nocardioides sp. R-C-SC26]|uniref:septum site-determining protein Ssd n=1 Tax=Nocardioides sp. R-C-SC26 TaxID=2870414 RepID=UPI001E2BC0AF
MPRTHLATAATPTPLLMIGADPALTQEVHRLAAAAGVLPTVHASAGSALSEWSAAALVLVGADAAAEAAELMPARRDGVVVVALGAAPDRLFRDALRLGATGVVELPGEENGLVELLLDAGDQPTRGHTIGVVGGCGGVGSTTLACALGQVAGRTGRSLVLDVDPLGPGADRVLGVEDRPGVRWDALCQAAGRLSARALRDAVPGRDGVAALSWAVGAETPVPPSVVREALSAARRGHDTVIVDLPRSAEGLLGDGVAPFR